MNFITRQWVTPNFYMTCFIWHVYLAGISVLPRNQFTHSFYRVCEGSWQRWELGLMIRRARGKKARFYCLTRGHHPSFYGNLLLVVLLWQGSPSHLGFYMKGSGWQGLGVLCNVPSTMCAWQQCSVCAGEGGAGKRQRVVRGKLLRGEFGDTGHRLLLHVILTIQDPVTSDSTACGTHQVLHTSHFYLSSKSGKIGYPHSTDAKWSLNKFQSLAQRPTASKNLSWSSN